MDWENEVLFYMKAAGNKLTSKQLEALLMRNGIDHQIVLERIRLMKNKGLIIKSLDKEYSFELTDKASVAIGDIYNNFQILTSEIIKVLNEVFHAESLSVSIKGGIRGFFFNLNDNIFTFEPCLCKDICLIKVQLPSKKLYDFCYKPNIIYVTLEELVEDHLFKTVILLHLKRALLSK